MSASHLGRNPFQKKTHPFKKSEAADEENHKPRAKDSKSDSWVRRICIEVPSRSFLFVLKTALEVKKILER